MSVHLDLCHGVMHGRDLNVLGNTVLKPVLQDSDFAALFELIDEFLHRDGGPNDFEDALDIAFLTFEVDEGTQHNWDGLWILADLE